jgi:hypothetical protein
MDPQMNIMRAGIAKMNNEIYPTIPPEVPDPICWRLNKPCPSGEACGELTDDSCQGRTAVSPAFIRNRGAVTYYDCPTNPGAINNPSPTAIFVRITDGSPRKFIINSKISPRLILKRGAKYQLNIVTDCCPFYFSSVPGGPADIFGLPPSSYDTRTYVIGPQVPDKFYYTSISGQEGTLVGEVVVV